MTLTSPTISPPARQVRPRRSGALRKAPVLALPATVWILVVFAIPTVVLLASSFLTYDGARVTGDLTVENYSQLLGSKYF